MNVNPHLQYLQSHQLQQQQQPMNATGQSPQISQLQLQQHQLQRQQLLNHHLQQQHQHQPIGTPTAQNVSTNPLLAAINGTSNGNVVPGNVNGPGSGLNSGLNSGLTTGASVNPVLQLQLQQQKQQQQHQFQQLQAAHQAAHQVQQQIPSHQLHNQAPLIKEVWVQNLENEFHTLRTFINDKTSKIFIAIHEEIPGIVARPVGTFKSSSDYHFQTLRSNSDLLNLIQLSFCVTKIKNNEISSSIIWQFNFLYDLTKEMFNEEHLTMLSQSSQINFQMHMTQGIPHFSFAELLIESGLLLDSSINWISYHAGYDLGFFVSLLINDNLPVDEKDFYSWCSKYFPNFYDLKYIGSQLLNTPNGEDTAKASNNKPSIEYLAEELHLLPISPAIRQHFAASMSSHFPGHQQQMTSTLHAYLSMECFKELLRQSSFDLASFSRFKGYIWGLGNLYGNGSVDEQFQINGAIPQPSTPSGGNSKSGVVHYGRPL
ncbi:hypothetical protein G9P44_003528 [Scheffersomyces stipitis]|nr:hypothetical protein G9P44_003528 [Scheffersomyces stipitis]